MLSGKNAMATIAVKDLAAAKKFHGGTLGFKTLGSEGEEAVIYQSGDSSIVATNPNMQTPTKPPLQPGAWVKNRRPLCRH